MTTPEFDANNVDASTVLFAGASPTRSAISDIDHDGDLDLLLYFIIKDLNLEATSTEATLTGEILDGTLISAFYYLFPFPIFFTSRCNIPFYVLIYL